MDSDMQKRRDRIRRRVIIAATGVGLICGAYVLPRVAQAVTRRADPLSLKVAAKAKARAVAVKSKIVRKPLVLLRPVSRASLVLVPQQVAARTPSKPPPPVAGYTRSGPSTGLSFY